SVESTKGEGTSFTVFLPSALGEGASTEPSPWGPSRSYAGRTALVVDDEPTVRHMVGKMLQALDFSVLEACDGYEALEIFEGNCDQIDLVVLDMNMPGMDGEATWWSLRNKRADLPILLSSGYPEQMIKLEGVRSAKVDAFIQKPYRRRDLCRRLEFLLDDTEH
ncbi:MAG: response regulator, partial [Myxococcota bacterium]